MRIRIRLFAILRQRAGTDQFDLEIAEGTTARQASQLVGQRYPALNDFVPRVLLAVNRQYAKPDRPLADGDELALLPAVSGGV
ncbi:MAG TPA: MoaD/ThiS family protein [Tepidisphaeraceae bacterium]|nr:MoaD/ThiS family protein [Tepidisphaeraceae bacterium]